MAAWILCQGMLLAQKLDLNLATLNATVLYAEGADMDAQTWLTPKKWAPKFDWGRFNDIQFTDAESTGITPKEANFIAKWRKPVSAFASTPDP